MMGHPVMRNWMSVILVSFCAGPPTVAWQSHCSSTTTSRPLVVDFDRQSFRTDAVGLSYFALSGSARSGDDVGGDCDDQSKNKNNNDKNPSGNNSTRGNNNSNNGNKINKKEKTGWAKDGSDRKRSKPSYSDNFLLQFHNQAQDEMQHITNSLARWNEDIMVREHDEIIEWRDSFDRNGLADFTPPMTRGLNCLMVGDGVGWGPSSRPSAPSTGDAIDGGEGRPDRPKLPWEEQPGAEVTTMRISSGTGSSSTPSNGEFLGGSLVPVDREDYDETVGSPLSLVRTDTSGGNSGKENGTWNDDSSSVPMETDPKRRASVYDCIVDQGLMDSVLATLNVRNVNHADVEGAVRDLVFEASTAIREHGIYVVVTHTLPAETRQLLEDCSLDAGLEWQFGLDGISDENRVVSVARRFCTGAMPKWGKLSRFQPPP